MAEPLRTAFVSTTDGSLLRSVRQTIRDADEVLICVAFMSESGIRLLSDEFKAARRRGVVPRLLVTTAFGTTDAAALAHADELGVETRIYNPGSGTYHPKLYLGRSTASARAFIGSANMTSGLTGNVEAGLCFEGDARTETLKAAWDWAVRLWDENDVVVEYPGSTRIAPAERFDPQLYSALRREIARDPVFLTIPRGRRNLVTHVDELAVLVQTERSAPKSEPVPAWMFNVAWAHLRLHRVLTNTTLLDELRVMRSSLVRAVLARIPGVHAGRDGALHWKRARG